MGNSKRNRLWSAVWRALSIEPVSSKKNDYSIFTHVDEYERIDKERRIKMCESRFPFYTTDYRLADLLAQNGRLSRETADILNQMRNSRLSLSDNVKIKKMTRQDYIEAIRKGECAIESDSAEFTILLCKEIFDGSMGNPSGHFKYYFAHQNNNNRWDFSNDTQLKSIKATELMNMKTEERKITPDQAQRIIDAACETWKGKLSNQWATSIVLKKDIEIKQAFYDIMRLACTTEQHKLFDEIFGADRPGFKAGDFVMTGSHFDGFGPGDVCEVTESLSNSTEGYVWRTGIKMENKVYFSTHCCRHATEEEIRKATNYPDGTPCWIWSHSFNEWVLRYANGKGSFYMNQAKSGEIMQCEKHKPFDPDNLPFHE